MFKIIKDENVIAITNTPKWIKLQNNGYFALCTRLEAKGVSVNGTVYHFPDTDIPESEEVIIEEIDDAAYIAELTRDNEARDEYSLDNDVRMTMLELLSE